VTLEDQAGTRATYSGRSEDEEVTMRVETADAVDEAHGSTASLPPVLEQELAEADLPNLRYSALIGG
jgi:hypothetical protein